MKVAPSIYSSQLDLLTTVDIISKTTADYIHVDCLKNVDEVVRDMKKLKDNCNLPIDMHLIHPSPKGILEELSIIGPDFLAIQYEDMLEPNDFFDIKLDFCEIGIAFTQKTSFAKVKDFVKHADYALLMTTIPGMTGLKFTSKSVEWIKKFKKLFPNKKIHIDGGVDQRVSDMLRPLDIHCIVSGSYLMNASSMSKSILNLKGGNLDQMEIF